jgi:hypothetical protein
MTDSQMCEAAGQHKAATRHTPDECPVNRDKTFDDIAQAQGWNAQSRESILMMFIDGDQDMGLVAFAQARADEENGVEHEGKAVPDFQMDVRGEYQGNAYPESAEYRIVIAPNPAGTFTFLVEDSGGYSVAEPLEIGEDLIDGIRTIRSTDHGLGAYEDDWTLPVGLDRQISWTLQTELAHYVVLTETQIDWISEWLDYADGTKTWDWAEQGEEWIS